MTELNNSKTELSADTIKLLAFMSLGFGALTSLLTLLMTPAPQDFAAHTAHAILLKYGFLSIAVLTGLNALCIALFNLKYDPWKFLNRYIGMLLANTLIISLVGFFSDIFIYIASATISLSDQAIYGVIGGAWLLAIIATAIGFGRFTDRLTANQKSAR